MQCRNCSGNEFRKTVSGNYKCVYCGTLYHEERFKHPEKFNFKSRYVITAVTSAIILLVLILTVFMLSEDTKNRSANPPGKIVSRQENGVRFSAGEIPEPEGAVLSVDVIPDSIGNHYFLALCRNTGKVSVRAPHVTVRLYSANNVKIGSGSGYSFMNNLNPGETTPVLILVQKPPKYSRFETEYTAELPFVIPENGVFEKRFTGEISDVALKMTGGGTSYKLKGSIKNTSDYNAKYVQVAAVIYNSSDKAIGYGSAFISEKVLKPGDFDLFNMYITTVAGKPDHYKLYYHGMVQ
ncbi:MAG TPA: FxLYD domain-containing protein [Spirochaetota bacterium]|nr:FxLYD domain-containing protein [Spirochaetota bacterium]HRX46719.1 FxLYD domain-containing protein [Spirochaetota bacterium]